MIQPPAITPTTRLRPMLGAFTGLMIGSGVAIGSGIFRTPGIVAANTQVPIYILAAWLFGGFFFLLAGLLVAELSTRFPDAGGEYVYLKHAYGRFIAFFFGWCYTVFIVGCGVAVMAVGFGDFVCGLLDLENHSLITMGPLDVRYGGLIGAAAIGIVSAINLFGLRTGAVTQDVLTLVKIAALLTIVGIAIVMGHSVDWWKWHDPANYEVHTPGGNTYLLIGTQQSAAYTNAVGWWQTAVAGTSLFAAILMPVMWCYEGTTDSVKMTEEIRDSRRTMPRTLIGTAVLVTSVYALVNWAFLRVLDPPHMATTNFVAADVLGVWLGPSGKKLTLLVASVVVLGAISSTIVSCVRVPFALGRDGLTFGFVGRMSRDQAPVGALLVAAGFAVLFSMTGVYEKVMSVYTLASGVLFGLVNLSLLVFRLRDRKRIDGEPNHFRCPFGPIVSVFLALTQFAIAVGIGISQPILASYTLGVLAVIAAIYFVWPKPEVTCV